MIVGVGVDQIEIERIARLCREGGARFLARVYTAAERDYCLGQQDPAPSFAARFCAKEAVMKCLGTGWTQGVTFASIEVRRNPGGAVEVHLEGVAAETARRLGIRRVHLSLSHDGTRAIAFAVAEA